MNEELFDVLRAILKKDNEFDAEAVSFDLGISKQEVLARVANGQNIKYLDEKIRVTVEGLEAMRPYKVDNAIIMAAGISSRCKPLSEILPKGLFRINGEVLIEREIKQLQEAGVSEIVVVVGYMAEAFSYLADRYGVTLVSNSEYERKNNVSSIYAAKEYLGNSYICCADNYYADNIFNEYEFESYYTCNYTDEFADEYCITEDERGFIRQIRRGGSCRWFTIGANYWTKAFSEAFKALLEEEYDLEDVGQLLIDDFHIRHFDSLPIRARKMKPDIVFEFDTLEEIRSFDPQFDDYARTLAADDLFGRYNGITRYAGVKTNNRDGRLHFNENLWGPSPNALLPFHNAVAEDLYLYDSQELDDLALEISKKYGIDYECIFLHNSGSEIAKSIITIMVESGDTVLLPMPHWSYYPGVIDYRFGSQVFYAFHEDGDKCYHDVDDLMCKAEECTPKIIIITSPAMPSGNLIRPDDLERVIQENPRSLVLVDQAYFGFVDDPIDVNYFISKYDNVVFSRTFSKFFGLAGLRLGYGMASRRAMKALWLDLPLLRLPILARRSVIECLRDEAYYARIRDEIRDVREWFYRELLTIDGIHPYKSDTNFLYMKVNGFDAAEAKERMMEKGFLFRIFDIEGQAFYRINVAPMETMCDFVEQFRETLSEMRREV